MRPRTGRSRPWRLAGVWSVACLVLMPAIGRAEETPPARRGFQLALRTGVAIPFGNVTPATAMSDALSPQVPLLLDVGWKPIRHLFLGAYLGGTIGGAAGQIADTCNENGINCIGVGFRGGLLAEVNIRPDHFVNPWAGLGFGYEIGGSGGTQGRSSIDNSVRGFELVRVLTGVDFRLQEYFGIGPFLDVSFGRYDYAASRIDLGGLVSKLGGDVNDKALHVWLLAGVRLVLLP